MIEESSMTCRLVKPELPPLIIYYAFSTPTLIQKLPYYRR